MPAATTPAPTRPKTKNGSPRKKGLKKKPTAVSKYEEELAFERTISRILLHRFEYDVARLFSTHVHRVAESHLPRLIMSALQIAPPGWVALNANTEDVKDCELLPSFYAGVQRQGRDLTGPLYCASLPWCTGSRYASGRRARRHQKRALVIYRHPSLRTSPPI